MFPKGREQFHSVTAWLYLFQEYSNSFSRAANLLPFTKHKIHFKKGQEHKCLSVRQRLGEYIIKIETDFSDFLGKKSDWKPNSYLAFADPGQGCPWGKGESWNHSKLQLQHLCVYLLLVLALSVLSFYSLSLADFTIYLECSLIRTGRNTGLYLCFSFPNHIFYLLHTPDMLFSVRLP